MRQYLIPASRPEWMASWEISPCREIYDPCGDSYVEAIESPDDLVVDPDIGGDVFYGVYLNPSESAIDRGAPPAIHVRDFDSQEEALAFVHALSGPPVNCSP